jgi:hypothetical protein
VAAENFNGEASEIKGAGPRQPTQQQSRRGGGGRSRAQGARPLPGLTDRRRCADHPGGSAEEVRRTGCPATDPASTPTRAPEADTVPRPSRSAGRDRSTDPESAPDFSPDAGSEPRWLTAAVEGVPGQPTTLLHDSKLESFVNSLGRLAGNVWSVERGHLSADGRPRPVTVPKPDRQGLGAASAGAVGFEGGGGVPVRDVVRSVAGTGSGRWS